MVTGKASSYRVLSVSTVRLSLVGPPGALGLQPRGTAAISGPLQEHSSDRGLCA